MVKAPAATASRSSKMHLAWMLLAGMQAGCSGMQLTSSSMGAVSRWGTNTSSSLSTASGTCTCEFSVDNDVDLVYVQEVAIAEAPNSADWSATKSVSFACDSHTLLALKGFDMENGCTSGGFGMKCTSTDPSSPWHYLVADRSWKAFGTSCTNGANGRCPTAAAGDTAVLASTPNGWTNQVFDDSSWAYANTAGQSILSTPQTICSLNGPAWLFRSPYLAATWFVLQYSPPDSETGLCVSAAGRCTDTACSGNSASDLQFQTCDPSDPYQLFKYEAGHLVSAAPGYRCIETSNVAFNGNCNPYSLKTCDWGVSKQTFSTLLNDGSTTWVGSDGATTRYLDARGGENKVNNEVWACSGGPNWAQKFDPRVAKEYVLTRRSRPDPARSVCDPDAGPILRRSGEPTASLAMPKTDAERAALTAALGTYSGLPGFAFLAGKYVNSKWVWDDGSDVTIKGTDNLNNGANEPYLCISTGGSGIGVFHDCGDQYYPAVCHTGTAGSFATPSPTSLPTASPTTASPTLSPTEFPTPATAAPPASPTLEVTVEGDPHVKNQRGQRFDLRKPGYYLLVEVPKNAKAGERPPLLRIDAHTKQVGGVCGPLYVDEVFFNGTWATASKGQSFNVKVDEKKANLNHPQHKQRFRFGPGVLVVLSHALTDTGVAYMNLRVSALSKARMPVGGLLGEDDQPWPEQAAGECEEQVSLLSIQQDV